MSRNNDEDTVSSYGLGNMWANAFGNAIYWGLSSGLQTVVSHAYGS
jgi:MATE family multidrug resistance protein